MLHRQMTHTSMMSLICPITLLNTNMEYSFFITLLDVEQAWTSVFYLKSFDMDSVQVGKAVFGKEIYTTLGIEPRTYS